MSSELGKTVGERIRIQRKRANLSQEELAFKSSFSTSFISDVERAQKSPSLDSLVRITSALGISLEELFLGTQMLEASEESALLQSIIAKLQPLNYEELKSVDEMIELLLNFKQK